MTRGACGRWVGCAALIIALGGALACNEGPRKGWNGFSPAPPERTSPTEPPAEPKPEKIDPAAARAEALAAARAQRAAVERELDQQTATLRQHEAKPPEATEEAQLKARAAERQQLAATQNTFKQAVAAEVVSVVAGLPENAQAAEVVNLRNAANQRLVTLEGNATVRLKDGLTAATTEEQRVHVYASMESALVKARAEVAVLDETVRRISPLQTAASADRADNASRVALERLLSGIQTTFVEEPRRPDWNIVNGVRPTALDREIEEWLRTRKLEADLQQYMWLADNGVFVNLSTGEVITGELRDRLAKNAKLQLVEALQAKGYTAGAVRTLFGWGDSRLDLAAHIEAGVRSNNWYSALTFIRPSMSGASPREAFLAFAHVLRQAADDVHQWRGQLIPEGGMGGVSGTLYEWFVAKRKAGLGLATRISSGEIKAQDERIEEFEAETGAVVRALLAAANTPNPGDLGASEFQLLRQFGFITPNSVGGFMYTLPSGNVTGTLQKDLNLLGATLLDVISAENAINVVIMVGAPHVAAARVGVIAEALGASELGIAFTSFAASALTGVALDAAGQIYYYDGTVQWDRLVLDNVVLGFSMPVVGAVAGGTSKALAALIKDKEKRKLVETALVQALGLSGETALQTYWQAKVKGSGVSEEDFLAALFSNVFGRGVPVMGALTRKVKQDLIRVAWLNEPPKWFTAELTTNRALREEWDAATLRASEVRTRLNEASETLRKILGSDVDKEWGDPAVVAKVAAALESKALTFAQLKLLFGSDEKQFTPLLAAIKEHRTRLFTSFIGAAREDARQAIERDFAIKLEAASKDNAAGAREAAVKWREDHLKLLAEEPIAPGSKDLTSDMDRSSASPYLRNSLRKFADAAFALNGGEPATSGQAYDVQEYFGVFMPIRRAMNSGVSVAGVLVPISGGGRVVTHAMLVEAEALAGALMYMTPAQRTLRKQNAIKEAGGDRDAVDDVVLLFELADRTLRSGEQELKAELDRLAQTGLDPTHPDTVMRARDNLYGRRALELTDKELRLATLDAGSQAAKELAAEIERGWNKANREGIEMYTTHTSINWVVMRGQVIDKSTRTQINDRDFQMPANGFVVTFTGYLNDQVMLITEHVNAFHEGHESAAQAGSALAKYSERVVGGLQGRGVDITSGKALELSTVSEALMKVRKFPDKLEAQLAQFAFEKYGTRDAEQGILYVARLLEENLPGMDGVFDPKLLHGPDGLPLTGTATGAVAGGPRFAIRVFDKDRQEEIAHDLVFDGPNAVVTRLTSELTLLEREVARLEAEEKHDAQLASKYRPQDSAFAARLEDERAADLVQQQSLPVTTTFTGVAGVLDQRVKQTTAVLNDVENRFKRSGAAAAPAPNQARRTRIENLKQAIVRTRTQLADVQALANQPLVIRDDVPAVGVWLQPPQPGVESVLTFTETAPARRLTDDEVARYQRALASIAENSPANEARTVVSAPPARPEVIGMPGMTLTPGTTTRSTARAAAKGPQIGPFKMRLKQKTLPGDLEPWVKVDTASLNSDRFNSASTEPRVQSILSLVEEAAVLSDARPAPRDALATLLALGAGPRGPAALTLSVLGFRSPAQTVPAARMPTVKAFFTSLGATSGEAFRMVLVNEGDTPVEVSGDGFVLEPLARLSQADVDRELQRLKSQKRATVTALGYCLEFAKLAPPAGMIFRLASEPVQEKFAGARPVLGAAKTLLDEGKLQGGQGAAYLHAVRQWSIWTLEQKFDEPRFTRAFLDHSRKNLESAGRRMTPELEAQIRQLLPARWQDIRKVLDRAAQP